MGEIINTGANAWIALGATIGGCILFAVFIIRAGIKTANENNEHHDLFI